MDKNHRIICAEYENMKSDIFGALECILASIEIAMSEPTPDERSASNYDPEQNNVCKSIL